MNNDRKEARPKLLFVCQVLPSPPSGGVYIRSHHTLAILSRIYDVKVICFFRRGQHANQDDITAAVQDLERFAEIEVFPIPQEWSRIRFVWDHVRSVVTRHAYTKFAYASASAQQRIAELMQRETFSVVHADSMDLIHYFPLFHGVRLTCTHHNVESALLRRRAGRESSRLKSAYLRLQASFTESMEQSVAPTVDLNIMVSDEDARHMQQLAPRANIVVVTNGVDVDFFSPSVLEDPGEIVFVGGLNWFPNLDGLEYFANEILPILRRMNVTVPIRWIGIATPALQAQYAKSGIELTGFVDDIRPFLARAACVVVPLRVGGGTRLKVLDAWASGKAMVSTRIGAEGLRTQDRENILLCDSPEEFAKGVVEVLTNQHLRERLEVGGRQTVEQYYSWTSIGATLLDAYNRLPSPSEVN